MDRSYREALEGGDIWKSLWLGLPRKEQRLIRDRVERGLALETAAHAALAVGYIRRMRTQMSPRGQIGAGLIDVQLDQALENNLAVLATEAE